MIQIQTVSIFYILNLSSMLIFDSLLRYCVIYKSFNCSLQFMENGCLEDSEIRSELSENFIVFVTGCYEHENGEPWHNLISNLVSN